MLTRREFISTSTTIAAVTALGPEAEALRAEPGSAPFMATGIKVGEVSTNSAIIWTRLTAGEKPIALGAPIPIVRYRDAKTGALTEDAEGRKHAPEVEYPNGATVHELEGAARGCAGEVRIEYAIEGGATTSTEWQAVDPERDFTHHFTLRDLEPNTRYTFRVGVRASKDGAESLRSEGSFKTAPKSDAIAPARFVVTTCHEYTDRDAPDGFRMYPAALKLNPDFMVHTGDIVYYDKLAKSLPLARWHWQRIYSLPTNVAFHKTVPTYFIKDDHDTWFNDCWPGLESPYMGEFTFAQGQAVFREQVPMGEKTYRTVRWGKDLQMWFVEGRDFRTPNDMADGPEKTIWGKEQKEWFKRSVAESDATFRMLISPTPLVGPDRSTKNDNHANSGFAHEGKELREFMAAQKNMIVACGDRHWQYVSIDPATGLREYACGPASDAHAAGWPKDEKRPEHKYLNVCGGFLAVSIDRANSRPTFIARHHSVDGAVLNEDHFTI